MRTAMDSTSKLKARNFPSAHDEAVAQQPIHRYEGPESAYRMAFADNDFILREELRPVRMQLELMKPELVQQDQSRSNKKCQKRRNMILLEHLAQLKRFK